MKNPGLVFAVLVTLGVGACAPDIQSPEAESFGTRLALEGGCPPQFMLMKALLADDPLDHNGDHLTCWLIDPELGLLAQVDNNLPLDAAGDCPPRFALDAALGAPEDRNLNGLVCTMARPDGSQVTIDDSRYGG